MSSKGNQDAWLWLGLAALGYYAAMTVHRQLLAIEKATEIAHHDKPPDKINKKAEDSLEISTLDYLTQSPNLDLKAAAVRIITERLFRKSDADSAWGILMRDISGWDFGRRDKALAILRYVWNTSRGIDKAQQLLYGADIYARLVECLCEFLPAAHRAETQASYRSQPERDALWLTSNMLCDVQHASPGDIVGKWLARYPFGGESTSASDKQKIIHNIINGDTVYDDSDFGFSMQSVLIQLFRTQALRDQMKEHNLIDPSLYSGGYQYGPVDPVFPSPSQSHDSEPLLRASDDWDFPDTAPSPREMEQSPEEQALRRRRREAMVLGESGRPVSREDIFERDPIDYVPDEEVEEELEALLEEVVEAEAADRSWLGWLSGLRPDGLAPANSWNSR